ncbi:MAG: glycoside hydrolase family 9 protein [Gemmatimonadaceae bacterium]|nr:glycoside hydrolase family 9 protein [Gemmatimonadaceae bacterium]
MSDAAKEVPDSGALHLATREAYRDQVLAGAPMGDGWYLRAFPVWYARRGNFGILLSQAKALATAARLRGDSAGLDLAQRQAQWIVGRNPFVQSMMYGEGHDWSQQYSVSSGDFVGSLPVGMQSRGVTDVPYWPAQNSFVFKEVWVHPASRWIWLMADLAGATPPDGGAPDPGFTARATTAPSGEIVIRLTMSRAGARWFELRSENLVLDRAVKSVETRDGGPAIVEWKARPASADAPWVAVVVADGNVTQRRELFGWGRR